MENKRVLGPRPTSVPEVAALSRARRAVLESIRAQDAPVLLSTLVEVSGLHENTLRGHLEGLERDGFVTRQRASAQGRGRPAWLWQATSSRPDEYAGLAAALARTLRRTSRQPVDDAVEAGHVWGQELAATRSLGEQSGSPVSRVRSLLEALGFSPKGKVDSRSDTADLRLTRCPLLEVAQQETAITCNVHRGLVAGALAQYGSGEAEVNLLPFSEPGACRLRIAPTGV